MKQVKFFKGRPPQNFLSPLLNTLSQITYVLEDMINRFSGPENLKWLRPFFLIKISVENIQFCN